MVLKTQKNENSNILSNLCYLKTLKWKLEQSKQSMLFKKQKNEN